MLNRERRNEIGIAGFAISIFSFGMFMWFFFALFSSRPRRPDPTQGLVYSLKNHGDVVYIDAIDSTCRGLLFSAMLVGFLTAFLVSPRSESVAFKGALGWLSAPTDLRNPSRRHWIVFWLVGILYGAFVLFAGRPIATLLVSLGIIL